jgi:anti-sigma factor RsiW
MIPYVGCEHARNLLDEFLDGELSLADQVAVESHLRWCRTCALRVEDMRLIATSLRQGPPVPRAAGDEAQAVSTMIASTLDRVRAEREASFGVRVREMFVDMRLLWPALGATLAVTICAGVAGAVLQASTEQRPESLAAIIGTLSQPGSERNPLRPDGGNTIPRVMDEGAPLVAIPSEDGVFWVSTVVGRDGRVTTADVRQADRTDPHDRTAAHDLHVEAVLDAVKQSRFAPAQTPIGSTVAVNMGWLIVFTTAEKEKPVRPRVDAVVAAPATPIGPVVPAAPEEEEPVAPAGRGSAAVPDLTTA